MPTASETKLRLVFLNSSGGSVTFTLPQPLADLDSAAAEAVMDDVIAKNIFTSPGGDLVAKQDVKVVETHTADLYDPPLS